MGRAWGVSAEGCGAFDGAVPATRRWSPHRPARPLERTRLQPDELPALGQQFCGGVVPGATRLGALRMRGVCCTMWHDQRSSSECISYRSIYRLNYSSLCRRLPSGRRGRCRCRFDTTSPRLCGAPAILRRVWSRGQGLQHVCERGFHPGVSSSLGH